MSALPEKVLLATDGSEDAALAAQAAGGLCAKTGAELHIVHALRLSAARPYPEMPEERAGEVSRLLGVRPKVRVAVGDPAVCLLETAEGNSTPERTLVAVGSRGLGAVRRVRLGSVSTNVLRAARGPVLVYPERRN